MTTLNPSGSGDSAQIQNAIDAANAAGGGRIDLSAGTFKLDTKINLLPNVEVIGAGRGCTFMQVETTIEDDAIDIMDASTIAHVAFTTDGTYYRTSGSMVRLLGSGSALEDFQMQFYHVGIIALGSSTSISDLVVAPRIFNGLMRLPNIDSQATAIIGANFSNIQISDLVISGPATGAQPGGGILLRHGDTAILSNINCTHHGQALLLTPQAGEGLFAFHCTNCLWDSGGDPAVSPAVNSASLIPSAGGKIINATFAATWFGLASGHGLEIAASVPSIVDCINLSGCEFMGNKGDGLRCNGPGVSNVVVSGGHSSGNLNGMQVLNGATGTTVTGLRAGPCNTRGPNSGYGILVAAGAGPNFLIVGNNLIGNTTGSLSVAPSGGMVVSNLI